MDKPTRKIAYVLIMILLLGIVFMLIHSCKSERNNNYPVVHKTKMFNPGYKPSKKIK